MNKLYFREIRPMFYEHATQGFSDKLTPAIREDSWFQEDSEEELRRSLEPNIEKYHGWIELIFDERYVAFEATISGDSEKIKKKYDGITDVLDTVLNMFNDIPITGENIHVRSGQEEMKSICMAAVEYAKKKFNKAEGIDKE